MVLDYCMYLFLSSFFCYLFYGPWGDAAADEDYAAELTETIYAQLPQSRYLSMPFFSAVQFPHWFLIFIV